jgi:cysteine-rich repeat protein
LQLCVTEQQTTACNGLADGASCMVGLQTGVCDHGVCIPASCGNGAIGPDEVCDDGNTVSGDGCRADCKKIEMCGDGAVDEGEDCDDGNSNPADGCDMCVTTAWTASVLLGGNATGGVSVANPTALAVDSHGALYVIDGYR